MSASNATSPASKKATYRHDPYNTTGKVFFSYGDDDVESSHASPAGTRHPALWGRVSFVPYPTGEFRAPSPPAEDAELVRVFVGQLPYFVTDMQLSWLCHTFGGGNAVVYPERIMKKQPNGERLPTGCIHAYATPEAVEAMAFGMHKRMLVDDTGVWHAQTHEELDVLKAHIAAMKADKKRRVPNRPYDSVVVQLAVSTFVPICPMPITQLPPERKRPHTSKRASPAPQGAADVPRQ